MSISSLKGIHDLLRARGVEPIDFSIPSSTDSSVDSSVYNNLNSAGFCTSHNNLYYTSGQIPFDDKNRVVTGKVGADLSLEMAKEAVDAVYTQYLRGLEFFYYKKLGLIEQIIMVRIFINAASDFTQFEELLDYKLLGELNNISLQGDSYALSIVGCSALPLNAAIELTSIMRLGGSI
jgi:enamine deaminase RidA (YjgF/YER057c/UK114 family)